MIVVRRRRKTPVVRVAYHNPALRGRTGKLRARSLTLYVNDWEVPIYSLLGAAKVLGRTPARVLQLIQTGKLRAHRLGKEWMILGPDLNKYLRAEREGLRTRYPLLFDE